MLVFLLTKPLMQALLLQVTLIPMMPMFLETTDKVTTGPSSLMDQEILNGKSLLEERMMIVVALFSKPIMEGLLLQVILIPMMGMFQEILAFQIIGS
jgi:hypothetical protein